MSRNLESDDEGYPREDDGSVVPEERASGPPNLGGENEAQPQRRQHKYTTADLQPERPWLRWFLICMAFLVVIVIMVLLSLFLQKLFDPPEDEDWSDETANNTVTDDDQAGALSGEALLFPKNSAFIDNVCAEDKLSGDTRQACEQVCAPAVDCCNPYSSGGSTCFEEQVAGCVTYSQCHALEGSNDPAYNDLERLCSMDAIELNRADCELACTTLSCCYTDVDSCVAVNFQACLDYSPCQNLRSSAENTQFIPAAEPGLDDECRDGDPTCGRKCKEATCCSDPTLDCYRDNFVSCLTYATCNQHEDSTTRITVAPIHTVVEAAPENLRNVCMQSYVDSTGPAECEAACAPADCCFAEGAASCFGEDPLGCMEYRGCAVL